MIIRRDGMGSILSSRRGVFCKAVRLKIEDTAALWNTPQLPGWENTTVVREGADATSLGMGKTEGTGKEKKEERKPKKVHLVIVTHGLHSNLGGDLLFMKESIDAGVKKAKVDRKARLAKEREAMRQEKRAKAPEGEIPADTGGGEPPPKPTNEEEAPDDPVVDDDEEVIVRGFSGNATKTEKGIKFLGKRLAKFVLSMTYPDQPFLPITKPGSDKDPGAVIGSAGTKASHKHSSIHKSPVEIKREYQFTKISFIGHSLGGLVQTYAIAYIQKHSPDFFDLITPINFIALASPILGLNHENPLYVKFALDFGLVGRTGQDLGLTWRAPTIAKSGWGAIVGNLGENAHKRVLGETQPESKPLLRILPTGPAHTALKRFRNRTLYSNVVNDGIVPLRTSCLLFLDWQGLERVEKARREAGLIENIVGFGWAELTGANALTPRLEGFSFADDEDGQEGVKPAGAVPAPEGLDSHEVPQPSKDAILEDDRQSLRAVRTASFQGERPSQPQQETKSTAVTNNANPFSGIFDFFKKIEPHRSRDPPPNPKQTKIYQRSQVLRGADDSTSSAASSRSKVTTGQELGDEADDGGYAAPPRTTFFESAADLINPRLPSVEYIIDPSKRPRTIFHDRVYHPSDIPPPPLKKRPSSPFSLRRRSYNAANNKSSGDSPSTDLSPSPSIPTSPRLPPRSDTLGSSVHDFQSQSSSSNSNAANTSDDLVDISAMKVEEKIARAYHRGMSWRKVLVKLEPDAHNNIIVRRTFANAFGWPVIAHMVDAHFSDAAEARLPDDREHNKERARPIEQAPDEKGKETKGEVSTTDDETDDDASEKPLSPTEKVASNTTITPAPPKLNTDLHPLNRVDSETRDVVSDLPSQSSQITHKNSLRSRRASKDGEPLPAVSTDGRPVYNRIDSVTWSERDWADSDDEEQEDSQRRSAEEEGSEKRLKPGPTTLGTSWNWTEKIVGKGATSPSTPKPKREEDKPSASDVD